MSQESPAAGQQDLSERLEQLLGIGVALSRERDINKLLEAILLAAKDVTNADGGTLYRVTEEGTLRFENDSAQQTNYTVLNRIIVTNEPGRQVAINEIGRAHV